MKQGPSLRLRLTSMVVALLLIIFANIAATLTVAHSRKAAAQEINLAGRQRMLTQRFAAQVLQKSPSGSTQEHSERDGDPEGDAGARTVELFEMTLEALKSGGETYTDLAMTEPTQLEGTSKAEIQAGLAEVEICWQLLKAEANVVGHAAVDSPAYGRSRARIPELATECLEQMNSLVTLYTANGASTRILTSIQVASGVAGLLVCALTVLYLRKRLVQPLEDALRVAGAVAQGDLTQTCQVHTHDEVGSLSQALNEMCAHLSTLVAGIQCNSEALSGSTSQLFETSAKVSEGASQTSCQSISVSAAAEEMSTNMVTMASSTEEISNNFEAVASAAEELTASIASVASNATEAAEEASNANDFVEVGTRKIEQLGTAAEQIGKVIETIQDIAEQTNLLALNATIEAARAGDAGKGFAVVATEVKELATQTGGAINDIRGRIEGIQDSASDAVKSIKEINDVIRKVSEVSHSIALSVSEQRATTNEIAEKVVQTAGEARSLTLGVNETAQASREITKNISHVDQAAKTSACDAEDIRETGEELTRLAEQLKSAASSFQV